MAKGNFKNVLPITLKHEGGWANHPNDPGGATNKGITIGTFRQFKPGATVDDLRAISDRDVETIYRSMYWNTVSGESLPAGVDMSVFDYGVNSGPGRASRALQQVVGVTRDGKIGASTLASTVMMGGGEVIKKLSAQRLSFLRGLTIFKHFGKGWTRRVAEVEAHSMKMWLAAQKVADGGALKREAEAAKKSSNASTAGAAASTGGGGGVVMQIEIGSDWQMWAVIGLFAVIAAGLALRARNQSIRAQAYAEVAA